MRDTRTSPQIATKFAPLPWRLTSDSVPIALKASLSRLGLSKCSLYMIHWWVVGLDGCGVLCWFLVQWWVAG